MGWVRQEKAALVETFRTTDPDAPTLDEGWDVRRLLAHLVQREQAPVAMVTDQVAHRPPGQEPGLTRLCDAARTPEGWSALVDRFVKGPPPWSPLSWASEQINFVEYVIHHEDVRRAGPDPAGPRDLPPAEQDAVWRQASLIARLALRKAPVGVRLATPLGRTRVVRKGDGVTLTGEPVELALWVSGRRGPAQVAVTGSTDAVEKLQDWVATT